MVGTRYTNRKGRAQAIQVEDDYTDGVTHLAEQSAPLGREYEPLAKDFKAVMKVISQLDGLGLGNLNIQLPKCVVLGEWTICPRFSFSEK